MCYGTIAKILVGTALIAAGLYALVPLGISVQGIASGFALDEFVSVLTGAVPLFAVLVGILIIWVGSEELKAELSKKRKR